MAPDVITRRLGPLLHQFRRSDQHGGRAETTLQGVALMERALEFAYHTGARQAFDGLNARAICLDRQHETAAHEFSIHSHRACTAYAVLAAEVGPGKAQLQPQEISEVLARRDAPAHRRTVYF
jgi:hypothetical protein